MAKDAPELREALETASGICVIAKHVYPGRLRRSHRNCNECNRIARALLLAKAEEVKRQSGIVGIYGDPHADEISTGMLRRSENLRRLAASLGGKDGNKEQSREI